MLNLGTGLCASFLNYHEMEYLAVSYLNGVRFGACFLTDNDEAFGQFGGSTRI